MTVVNILIGMVVGAAVVWFLIAPAVNQTKSSTKNRNVIALSEQIASQKTQIQTLKDELEGYRNSSDEVESAKQTGLIHTDSYDALTRYTAVLWLEQRAMRIWQIRAWTEQGFVGRRGTENLRFDLRFRVPASMCEPVFDRAV